MQAFLKLDKRKQRQILGNLLYPLVKEFAGEKHAPKITGMLVDFSTFDVFEMIEFLEKPDILQAKISEAKSIIQNNSQ